MYIYPSALEEFKYTEECKGCERVKEGVNSEGRSRKHDQECRRRIIQRLRERHPEGKRLRKLESNTIELANPEEHERLQDKEKEYDEIDDVTPSHVGMADQARPQ